MDFRQMVGEQIRKARRLRGMTQERLAEQSGLSFSYISDVERGTRNISLESLGKIINALGVKPAQLFEDIDEIPEHSRNGELHSNIEDLVTLLSDRQIEEVEFVLTVTREFLNTIDRKNR